jgi:non-specific serine/threonine protein kinase/serine/threonine-protein kinase
LLLGRPAARDENLADAISHAVEAKPFELDAKARAELPRDLGLIVARCLQPEPGQRYRDVNTLRDDLKNFLEHRPVTVSAPTLSYRLRKTIQRNRLLSAVTALLLLTIVGGSTLYAVRINEARATAENQAAISEEVIDFLVEVFNVSDPGENLGSTVTARELLEKGADDLEDEFRDRPLIRARLQMVIAGVFWKLGLYNDAVPLYESARRLRRRELGPDHRDTLIAGNDLAIMYELQNRFEEAESLYLDILERQRRVLGPDDINSMKTLQNLGSLYHKLARYEEAAAYWEDALERRRRVLGADDPEYATTLSNLPIAYIGLGQLDRAQALFIEGLDVKRRVFGPEHPDTIGAVANVGLMYVDRAMYDEARPYLEEAVALSRRVQGETHPITLMLTTSAAGYHIETRAPVAEIDSLAAARRVLSRVLGTAQQNLGADHQITIEARKQLARADNAEGNYQAALATFEEILANQVDRFGPLNQQALAIRAHIATTYALQGDFGRAAIEFESVIDVQAREMGARHPDRLNNLLALGDAYLAQGLNERAEACYREAIDGFTETLGGSDPQSRRAIEYLEKIASESRE